MTFGSNIMFVKLTVYLKDVTFTSIKSPLPDSIFHNFPKKEEEKKTMLYDSYWKLNIIVNT